MGKIKGAPRCMGKSENPLIIENGIFQIDLKYKMVAFINTDIELKLTVIELKLLEKLMQNEGNIVNCDDLSDAMGISKPSVSKTNNLEVHVCKLRKKIRSALPKAAKQNPKLNGLAAKNIIFSSYGKGYGIIASDKDTVTPEDTLSL